MVFTSIHTPPAPVSLAITPTTASFHRITLSPWANVHEADANEGDRFQICQFIPAPQRQKLPSPADAQPTRPQASTMGDGPMKKIRVGILFGGRSGEHEVSLLSAASVLQAIDRSRYDIVPIGITKEGRWVTAGHAERLLTGEDPIPAKHLRAGDPDATSAAAVLRRGESVLVPPVPSEAMVPFDTPAGAVTHASPDQVLAVDVDLPRPARHLRRRRHHPGPLRARRHRLRRLRRPRLRYRHGQGRHEPPLRQSAQLPIAKHVTFLRGDWEKAPQEIHAAHRNRAQISRSSSSPPTSAPPSASAKPTAAGTRPRHRTRRPLRPQNRHRAGVGGKKSGQKASRARSRRPRQRHSGSLRRRRSRPRQRVLRLRSQVPQRRQRPPRPRATSPETAGQRSPRDGHSRLPGLRLRRPRPRRLPHGARCQRKRAASSSTRSTPSPASPPSACTRASGPPPACPIPNSSTASSSSPSNAEPTKTAIATPSDLPAPGTRLPASPLPQKPNCPHRCHNKRESLPPAPGLQSR